MMLRETGPSYDWLCFDTETLPISANRAELSPPFVAMGFIQADNIRTTITQDKAWAKALVEAAMLAGRVIVGHNLAFDLGVLGIVPPPQAKLHDTMFADLLLRLADNDCEEDKPGPPLTKKLAELALSQGIVLMGKGTTQLSFRVGEALTAQQEQYLSDDVMATRAVFLAQVAQGVPGGLPEMTLHVRARMALDILTANGIRVDMRTIEELEVAYQGHMKEAAVALGKLYKPARTGRKGGQYAASLKQKEFQLHVECLAEARGVEAEKTEKGRIAIGKQDLLKFQDDPVVKAWLEYKSYQKLIGTFLCAWKSTTTGRVHPTYKAMMRTGRTSSADPNFQQVPSRGGKSEVKRCFLPEPGAMLYEADYGQLELCCLGYLTQGTMLRLINNGVDLHRQLAAWVFEKGQQDVTKEERQLAKAANFGFPGGLGAKRFREYVSAYGVQDPGERKAQRLLNAWLAAFPEMRKWREDTATRSWSDDVLRALSGRDFGVEEDDDDAAWQWIEREARKYRLPKSAYWALRDRTSDPVLESWIVHRRVIHAGGRQRCPVSYTESKNSPFQGLAANLTKTALAKVVLDSPGNWRVHSFIHDSILFSAWDSGAVHEVHRRMVQAAGEWLPGVRVLVEVNGPGTTWADAKTKEWHDESTVATGGTRA